MSTCRTCVWLIVPTDKRGRRVPRKDNAYRCAYVASCRLPKSITEHYSFSWPPASRYMGPDEGEGCMCYEQRTQC